MTQGLACIGLGKERIRAKVWRRLFRSSFPYSRAVALAVTVLFVLSIQAHLGKIASREVKDDAPRLSTRESDREPLSGRSARRLTSSMHSPDAITGIVDAIERSKVAVKVPPRTLPPIPSRESKLGSQSRTLRFLTCNGFANQRLSLAYGMILAKMTNRIPVLPSFLLNGLQRGDAWITDIGNNGSLPMSAMYDMEAFREGIASYAGMEVLRPEDAPPISEYVQLSLDGVADAIHHTEREDDLHVAVDCPLLRLPKEVMKANENVFWAVMDSLKPSERFAEIIDKAVRRLEEAGRELVERTEPGMSDEKRGGSRLPNAASFHRTSRTDKEA